MSTIEERAKKYLYGDIDSHPVRVAMYDAYIDGATEQRQIDTEKVYHALEKILSKEMLDNVRKILEE